MTGYHLSRWMPLLLAIAVWSSLASAALAQEHFAVTISFAQPQYTTFEGGPAVPVVARLSAALDHAITIPLKPLHYDVTETDYTIEAIAPASLLTVFDPADPSLLGLTFPAGTTETTLMVTAVDDTGEDPGYFYLVTPVGAMLPPSVADGDPAGIKVNIHEAHTVAVSFTQSKYWAFEDGPPARVMVRLTAPLDHAVTIGLNRDGAFDGYTIEAVPPASFLTVFDPARPHLMGLTFPAGTTEATLLFTAIDDPEEDPTSLVSG